MIPSVEIRVTSMMRALEGIVIPALAHDSNARDQAQLVLGHLGALLGQYDWLEEFERLEHVHTRQMAARLLATAESGYRDRAEVQGLKQSVELTFPETIADCRAAQRELVEAVARFVECQGRFGSPESVRESTLIVADAEHQQSLRDRSVFAAFGYESGDPRVKPMEAMMQDFRDETSKETVLP